MQNSCVWKKNIWLFNITHIVACEFFEVVFCENSAEYYDWHVQIDDYQSSGPFNHNVLKSIKVAYLPFCHRYNDCDVIRCNQNALNCLKYSHTFDFIIRLYF